MALKGIAVDEFKKELANHLTPSKAISSPEHLKGREKALVQIDRAFNSPGKHVFIFGDRGVGKTSLAQTAASIHQSSDGLPLQVACGSIDFFEAVRDVAKLALPVKDIVFQRKVEQKYKAGVSAFGLEIGKSISSGVIPPITSINEAVALLRFVGEIHSRNPIVIFDEFDQVKDSTQREKWAQLVKQLSDQDVNLKCIFCGIGNSLNDLIDVHMSAGRYFAPIEVERLSHDARWDIIRQAAEVLGINVQENHLIRIGQISDGYPHYVHLIGEQMFWNIFDDSEVLSICHQRNFEAGIRGAVQTAEPTLKMIYDRATQKYSDDYQEVLWALSDDALLRRQISDIYDKSYQRIMLERSERKKLTKEQFYGRMNNLKTARHGEILRASGAGWYEFRENVVRGYVRLRAEKEGVAVGREGAV